MYNEILFFFSAIGVFNTLLIAFYLLSACRSFDIKFLLGLFLLFISIRVGVSCIYFFHPIPPFLIQMGLCANLLSGICVYAFLRSLEKEIRPKDQLHLLVALIALIVFGIIVPFASYFTLWDNTIRYIFHGILTVYIIAAWLEMYPLLKTAKQANFRLKALILSSFSLICLCYAISLYTTYILGPILYSVIFYASSFVFYYWVSDQFNKKSKKYRNKKIQAETAEKLIAEIDQCVSQQELFKRQNLKINDLADLINMPPNKLSQVLNDNLGVNFSSYINAFRVEEAKKLLSTNKRLTIEAIGLEAGFSSKTTFFKVFKKQTGQTPKSYLKSSAELENGTK